MELVIISIDLYPHHKFSTSRHHVYKFLKTFLINDYQYIVTVPDIKHLFPEPLYTT